MKCYNIFFFVSFFLIGCSSTPRFVENDKITTEKKPIQTQSPTNKNTNEKILLALEGIASYYAHDFHGKKTSNGEIFDMNAITAAHRTFPFGTKVRVTNLENNKKVVVRVNDRGPFKEGRIIDLSLGAAKEIELIKSGTVRVRLEVLEWGTGK